jgi:hypothetical protein
MSEEKYNIVRFYQNGKKRIIHKNVDLDVAQLHCRNSRTKKVTKEGRIIWFDGYTISSNKFV